MTETTFGPGEARSAAVRGMASARAGERGPLLEILHDVMSAYGWIAESDVRDVAEVLNMSVAEVHGVVGFYSDFRRTPPPPHTIGVCRGEACQAVGAEALRREVEEGLAHRDDVEVREMFCFGNCALGPSVSIDGVLRGRMTAERVLASTGEVGS